MALFGDGRNDPETKKQNINQITREGVGSIGAPDIPDPSFKKKRKTSKNVRLHADISFPYP